MLVRKSVGGTVLDAIMAFVEDMILVIIVIIIVLLLFYFIVFAFYFFSFWKSIMLLLCTWGLIFKAMSSKVGLNL